MGSKKDFDREKMYRKIMPTYYETTSEDQQNEEKIEGELLGDIAEDVNATQDRGPSLFENKEIKWLQDRDKKAILYNITEKLVLSKLDMVLGGMNCCKCDRCRMDIISIALNSLPPRYVVGSRNHIEDKAEANEFGPQVTSAVLKAALTVRKQPRH